MNAMLRVNFAKQVNMVWHHFQFNHLNLLFCSRLIDNFFQSFLNAID